MHKDHFSTVAGGYAAFRPVYPPEVGRYLASLSQEKTLAWESGCGSGQLTLLLAEHFDKVIATDISAEQLAEAPRRTNIQYRQAPAEASSIESGIASLIVTAQAAHWYDLPRYYEEARRVAKPGAIIALVSYGMFSLEGNASQVIWDFYHHDLEPYWPPERKRVDEGYRTLDFPFREIAAPSMQMTADWDLAAVLGYIETWSALRQLEKAGKRELYKRFADNFALAWGNPETKRKLTWPLYFRVGYIS